jgi:divalent metal cation (Fe/Co/Zn/Cd) transporter
MVNWSLGTIVVALIIITSWSTTAYENIELIVGKAIDDNFLKKVIYISINHDKRIEKLDTVRGYHVDEKHIIEVDIVLPKEMKEMKVMI